MNPENVDHDQDSSVNEVIYFDPNSGKIKTEDIIKEYDIDNSPEEKNWRITKVEIYTVDGLPIFVSNQDTKLDDFDSTIVLQFYQAIEKFAENNLSTRLVDFKVGSERVIFKTTEQYIFIIGVKLLDEAKSGLFSDMFVRISALISDITTLLFFQLGGDRIEETTQLQDSITEMIDQINHSVEKEMKPDSNIVDLDISHTVITDELGMPLFTRSYNQDSYTDDSMLFSMFLHALNVFFTSNFSGALKEINFGSSRLYINNYQGNFYAIMVQFEGFINIKEGNPIHLLSQNILEQMQTLVTDLADDINLISEDELELVIDNYIYKARYQLSENLNE